MHLYWWLQLPALTALLGLCLIDIINCKGCCWPKFSSSQPSLVPHTWQSVQQFNNSFIEEITQSVQFSYWIEFVRRSWRNTSKKLWHLNISKIVHGPSKTEYKSEYGFKKKTCFMLNYSYGTIICDGKLLLTKIVKPKSKSKSKLKVISQRFGLRLML